MGRASGSNENGLLGRRERDPELRAVEYLSSDDPVFEKWIDRGPFGSNPIPLPEAVASAIANLDRRFAGRAQFQRDLHAELKEIPLPSRPPVWGEMVGAGVWSALQVTDLITDDKFKETLVPIVEAMLTNWDDAQHLLRDERRQNFQMTLLASSTFAGMGGREAEGRALMALSGALATDPRVLLWMCATHATQALVYTGDLDRAKRFVLDLARFFADADSRVVD